jgi:hypothetical protein
MKFTWNLQVNHRAGVITEVLQDAVKEMGYLSPDPSSWEVLLVAILLKIAEVPKPQSMAWLKIMF